MGTLQPAQYLVPRGQFDVRPPFFICGGLVFQPLSNEYLQGWNMSDRPTHLQELFLKGHLTPQRREVVIISQILADKANAGYESGWIGAPVVLAVNGENIRDLAHLVQIIRRTRENTSATQDAFLVFDVDAARGPSQIALHVNELAEADERTCSIYGVPRACCSEHYFQF